MATADRRLDLLDEVVTRLPEAWEQMTQCGPMRLERLGGEERRGCGGRIASLVPMVQSHRSSIGAWRWMHRALLGSLPGECIEMVLRSKVWRERLQEEKMLEWTELLAELLSGANCMGSCACLLSTIEDMTAATDKTLLKELSKLKVQATWVPWTDSRLSLFSGYGAGVISRDGIGICGSYGGRGGSACGEVRGSLASQIGGVACGMRAMPHRTASAIEAARLALCLAAMRGLSIPGLTEMRDATLATLCHGDTLPLTLLEQKLYVGERVGEIGDDVRRCRWHETLQYGRRRPG